MAVLVATTVGAGFRLKRGFGFRGLHAEQLQHFAQHRIRFDRQIARANLDGDMTIAEMVGGAGQQ